MHPIFQKLRERAQVLETDMDRILSLPIRQSWPEEDRNAIRTIFDSNKLKLRDIQADALLELAHVGSLFGIVGVGWGKTIISLLAGVITDSKKTLLIVPPEVCYQLTERDIPQIQQEYNMEFNYVCFKGRSREDRAVHANVCHSLYILPYSLLSQPDAYSLLECINPDLIVLDEAHRVKRRESARSKRLFNYLNKINPDCKLVALSGTITRTSLFDYWHIIKRCLGNNSPLPNLYSTIKEWNDFIGVSQGDTRGEDITKSQMASIKPVMDWVNDNSLNGHLYNSQRDHARSTFALRLKTAPGVVQTEYQSIDSSLLIDNSDIKIPEKILAELEILDSLWVDPNGDTITEVIQYVATASQISSGFYYQLKWPDGVEDWVLDQQQLKCELDKELRKFINSGVRRGYDTPMLVYKGLKNRDKEVKVLQEMYDGWVSLVNGREIPDRNSSVVWLDDYKIRTAVLWSAHDFNLGGIIWYNFKAVGEKLSERMPGAIFCPAGCDYETMLDPDRVIIASIPAHSTGKNLQHFSNQLIVDPPRGGAVWEQMLGRTHRQGQKEDEVHAKVLASTEFEKAKIWEAWHDCEYVQLTGGGRQKMLMADWALPPTEKHYKVYNKSNPLY